MVVTEHPLKSLLRKADFFGRISRWAIELGQYDIQYQPRTAIKAQVLADFIGEFTTPNSVSNEFETELGSKKDTEAHEKELNWKLFTDTSWKVYVDGSSNYKGSGAGVVLQSPEGLVIEQAIRLGFKASNNEAEYEALLAGLRNAKALGVKYLTIFSDSQLVTSQLTGE